MQTVASLVSTVQGLMEELKISATTALDNRILGSLAIPSSTGAPVLQTTEVPYVRVACHSTLILRLYAPAVFVVNEKLLLLEAVCFSLGT